MRLLHRFAAASCALALGVCAGPAVATDFGVSGSVSINGSTGALPDGLFTGSSYDAATGAIGEGTFKFPQVTAVNGSSSLTYQLSQGGTSSGSVDGSGVAVLSNAALTLTAISGSFGGAPVTFGPSCIFEPINVVLVGSGSASGLDLADGGFTIPPTSDDCNGFAPAANSALAGSLNTLQIHIDGDFTPPGIIFQNGFDLAR